MELLLQIGGTPDHGNGQFNEPTGIVVDSSGNVFVVDRGNNPEYRNFHQNNYATGVGMVILTRS